MRRGGAERAGAHRARPGRRATLAGVTATLVAVAVVLGAALAGLWFVRVGDASARTVVGTVVRPAPTHQEADGAVRPIGGR